VIIGGGIVGCAVAYYLTEEGESDVLVVEAEELGSGSTGGSFGGVRQQFSTPLEIEFSRRGLAFCRPQGGASTRRCHGIPTVTSS
jgi:sarcosine oxidase subunit beta